METLERVKQILADNENLDDDQLVPEGTYDACVLSGLLEYSRIKPQVLTDAQTLPAGDYEFDLPDAWVSGFSEVRTIEHPGGYRRPRYLSPADYRINESELTWRVLKYLTNAASTATLTFTAPHTSATIPASDRDAVCYFAAEHVALSISAGFGRTNKPSIPADSVNYRDKADVWRAIARSYRQTAMALMGMALDGQGNPINAPMTTTATWGWPSW